MTKEQFLNKWVVISAVKDKMLPDLEAVIAQEIAKVQEKPQPKPQPKLNPIEKAYHNYEPIRWILWNEGWNIKKHSDTESIDRNGKIYDNKSIVFNFDTNPEEWEIYTEPVQGIPQPENLKGNCSSFDGSRLVDQEKTALNPIADAYERGEKVKRKTWEKHEWYKKHTDTHIIDNNGNIFLKPMWDINSMKDKPKDWEIFTEPTEKPSSQVILDKPFDKERFEAMFRSVVANGGHELDHKQAIELTEEALKQLDVFYASKGGGNNG